MTIERQLDLPFPLPRSAKVWPNQLGFDLYELEFWLNRGCRDYETGKYSESSNWVRALYELINDPRDCR